MNKLITIIIFSTITCNCFSTEQLADLLIIGKDTVYLKSFPLEMLEFEKSLFHTESLTFHILPVGEDIVPHGK